MPRFLSFLSRRRGGTHFSKAGEQVGKWESEMQPHPPSGSHPPIFSPARFLTCPPAHLPTLTPAHLPICSPAHLLTRSLSHLLRLAATVLICLFATVAFGEQQFRFPPPEFESGYQMPVTQTPAPRAVLLQYADVAVLVGALALASYLALKKRSRKGLLALSIFSLLYFGFYRKGCVCAIGSLQNVALGLADPGYAVPLTVAAFFLAPLVAALFAGRTFCAAVCPHGAMQDLVLLKPVKVPGWLEQGLSVLPFIYLGAAVLFAATGSAFIICRYDPFVPIFRLSGSFPMLLLGAAFLLVGMFVGRPYCRFLCPYGALLRLAATVSKWRVTVTPDECKRCRFCEDSCPYGALRLPTPIPAAEPVLTGAKRRLVALVVLLPVLMLAGGWVGSRLALAASRVHPTVELAERFIRHQATPIQAPPQTAASLSLARAELQSKELVGNAIAIRNRFGVGGWWFGIWMGLVVGVKLIGLSLRREQPGYEPDRAACVACARCFVSCPREGLRLKKAAAPAQAANATTP